MQSIKCSGLEDGQNRLMGAGNDAGELHPPQTSGEALGCELRPK